MSDRDDGLSLLTLLGVSGLVGASLSGDLLRNSLVFDNVLGVAEVNILDEEGGSEGDDREDGGRNELDGHNVGVSVNLGESTLSERACEVM